MDACVDMGVMYNMWTKDGAWGQGEMLYYHDIVAWHNHQYRPIWKVLEGP
jgi:hypothetical protein